MAVTDLLERAAGLDPDALAEWGRLECGMGALFPGTGLYIVRLAKRAGLDPFAVDRLDFHVGQYPIPALWFVANPKHARAYVTPYGASFLT